MTDPYDTWQRERESQIAAQYPCATYPVHEERFELETFTIVQAGERRYAHQFLGDFPFGLLNQQASVSVEPGQFREYVRAELRATMMGKKIPPHTVTETRPFSVDVYDSPWQHFKANHEQSWWLGWLVRRRPVRTHKVTHTATLTATWDQFVGFPWQNVVSHLDRHARDFGPAVLFANMHHSMVMEPPA